ncbi:MAG: Asp-tRNA(Asn)/Glu-tRNA(Gln) amidotransferase subunit GatC [Deltaproteobacteria bacterium]|nr:Asp-tRNA(Asn)/Glu-tRNA(Gln) amidotransferase subunit GatC [Deltaproteobacteria bacterium]
MDAAPSELRIDIRQVATLARLSLDAAETRELEGALDRILEYVAQLDELDLDGVEPTSHPVPLRAAWREDVAAPPLSRDEAFANAPDHDGTAFVVPRVV